MRCIAAYHVGELGLQSLRPRLVERSRGTKSFFVSRVLERTLATLSHEPEDVRA